MQAADCAKGKLAYELVSPEGDAYIMQSSNIPVHDRMAKLGDRLQLLSRSAREAAAGTVSLEENAEGKRHEHE